MPLIMEGGRVPPRWAERKSCRLVGSARQRVRTIYDPVEQEMTQVESPNSR